MSFMDRHAASRNIEAAIRARKEKFSLAHLDWSAAGYSATFRQGALTVRKTDLDEGTAEDMPPAGQPATASMATLLDQVRREFGGSSQERP
jgi:hypothetical protein